MTTVKVIRKQGRIVKVRASGHAGFDREGKDIVCAAVTSVLETALLGLNRFGIAPRFVRDLQAGSLEFEIDEALREDKLRTAEIILETMYAGVEDIAKDYPRYLKLEDS